MHTSTCAHPPTHAHAQNVHTRKHVRTHVHTHMYARVHTRTHARQPHTNIRTNAHTYTHMRMRTHPHKPTHAQRCVNELKLKTITLIVFIKTFKPCLFDLRTLIKL